METNKRKTKKNSGSTNEKQKQEKIGLSFEDIEDVEILLRIEGNSYPFVPKIDEDKEEMKQIKLSLLTHLTDSHILLKKSLEEIIIDKLNNDK